MRLEGLPGDGGDLLVRQGDAVEADVVQVRVEGWIRVVAGFAEEELVEACLFSVEDVFEVEGSLGGAAHGGAVAVEAEGVSGRVEHDREVDPLVDRDTGGGGALFPGPALGGDAGTVTVRAAIADRGAEEVASGVEAEVEEALPGVRGAEEDPAGDGEGIEAVEGFSGDLEMGLVTAWEGEHAAEAGVLNEGGPGPVQGGVVAIAGAVGGVAVEEVAGDEGGFADAIEELIAASLLGLGVGVGGAESKSDQEKEGGEGTRPEWLLRVTGCWSGAGGGGGLTI